MKRRISTILMASIMLVTMLSVTVCAGDVVTYRNVNYSTAVTVGTPVTGTFTFLTPEVVCYGSTGAALGFTVELEQGETYVLNLTARTESVAVPHVINILVLNNVMSGVFASDILSKPVVLHEMGKVAATSVRFTAPSNGSFRVLAFEGSVVADDYTLIPVTATVSVDKLVWNKQNIADAAALNALRDSVNSFSIPTANLDVKIGADIDLGNANWQGFKCFAGKIDGGNYSISNFGLGTKSIAYSSFLGKVMGGAQVSNINLKPTYVYGAAYTGALAGMVENSTVDNCTSSGRVDGAIPTGALIGEANDGAVITNSSSSCSVNGLGVTGGFIGDAYGDVDIRNCSASGAVTAGGIGGGFIGLAAGDCDIEYCSASGAVSGILGSGGFAGSVSGTEIDECCSTGNVEGAASVGGFAGTIVTDNEISNSYSTGAVTIAKVLIPKLSAGGFAGSVTGGDNVIENCYCIGAIDVYANYVGGFTGHHSPCIGITEYKNCYTASAVTISYKDADDFGTFIGECDTDAKYMPKADNCYSSAATVKVGTLEIANAAPCADIAASESFAVKSVDFTSNDAVAQLEKSLNDYAAQEDDYDSWSGRNAANGPELGFKGVDGNGGENDNFFIRLIKRIVEFFRNLFWFI